VRLHGSFVSCWCRLAQDTSPKGLESHDGIHGRESCSPLHHLLRWLSSSHHWVRSSSTIGCLNNKSTIWTLTIVGLNSPMGSLEISICSFVCINYLLSLSDLGKVLFVDGIACVLLRPIASHQSIVEAYGSKSHDFTSSVGWLSIGSTIFFSEAHFSVISVHEDESTFFGRTIWVLFSAIRILVASCKGMNASGVWGVLECIVDGISQPCARLRWLSYFHHWGR